MAAATWNAANQHPYLQFSPLEKPSNMPCEHVVDKFNSWSRKAETIARNIWNNLKMGQSVPEAACGKVNLMVKAATEGGFESIFKQSFTTYPHEKLKKAFACYLSTTTGPVAGTLFLSTARVTFCSDRPLVFIASPGKEAWSYYKVVIELPNITSVNPVSMRENPSEKYIQIVTVDGHSFWFMGFVNFQKASQNLLDSLSEFRGVGHAAQPVAR
ncbi:GEM-like protein 5 [Diospyros lotus]|uniref:GEM-like protein 5 n=1 Tax=Diospyros lotus TaxID=55363 RepID=UPI00224DC86E|nr:GEM-like protein 5 [Diospyros lotus]XP_052187796.1 GEM-like protein 5 [Diospyros lotus]XP_052187797.1 GEM-like protein 5 [Diospyros lotus]